MKTLSIDLETYSSADIGKTGVYRSYNYAEWGNVASAPYENENQYIIEYERFDYSWTISLAMNSLN